MDNLTACVLAAQRAGLSYGQYMAKRDSNPIQVAIPGDDARKCVICGRILGPEKKLGTKYCGNVCRYEAAARRARDKARERKRTRASDMKTCVFCGKQFLIGSEHAARRYCSPECREDAVYARRRVGFGISPMEVREND